MLARASSALSAASGSPYMSPGVGVTSSEDSGRQGTPRTGQLTGHRNTNSHNRQLPSLERFTEIETEHFEYKSLSNYDHL